MNSTYAAALVRGLVLTVVAFGGAFVVDMLSGSTMQHALLMGMGAGLPVLGARFGGEGIVDASRAGKTS